MTPAMKALVARARTEYALVAGVCERSDAEERAAQRLYGLLVARGEDVWAPEPRVANVRPTFARDRELDDRVDALFAEVLGEAQRDNPTQGDD